MIFDNPVDRRGTNSVKWTKANIANIASNGEAEPFWVADMDFQVEEHIKAAGERLAHVGVYGYPAFGSRLEEAASSWIKAKHGWDVQPDDITFTMGMLHGIASAIDLFTEKGDKILVPSPMYKPFREMTKRSGRVLVEHDLAYHDGSFSLDRERFSRDMEGVRCILFCSPQNPSGIVFSESDLIFILEEGRKHGALVMSDEIHADLVHPGSKHLPMGMVNAKVGADTITFFAPSKTFNIAGEHMAFVHFSSDEMKETFRDREETMRLSEPSIAIGELTIAAYENGLRYNEELCAYLGRNAAAIRAYLKAECPELVMADGNASFVTFIDASAIYDKAEKEVLSHPEKYPGGNGGGVLSRFFGVNASVAMNDGTWFGEEWKRFVRFNYGTSTERVMAALERMKKAVDSL